MRPKTYIGDSVYAEENEFGQIVLTTEDEYSLTNTIILDPEVWYHLRLWVSGLE